MKKISVRESGIHGNGLFADEDIKQGERIQYINGKREKRVTKNETDSREIEHWIGTGKFSWINTEGTPFRYINHSCDPNAAIAGIKTVVALEEIKAGEEVTIDYSMTDADPYWNITCHCGTKTCRKDIRAIYTVPQEVFRRHMPYVPRYFQRAYIRNHIHTRMGKKGKGSKRSPQA